MRRVIENKGPNVMIVGSSIIPPGESRDFDEAELPPEHRHAAPAPKEEQQPPQAPDPLEELAAKGVKDITAAIPALSDDDLGKLEKLESGREQPRKTVLEAIAEETLKRAGGGE